MDFLYWLLIFGILGYVIYASLLVNETNQVNNDQAKNDVLSGNWGIHVFPQIFTSLNSLRLRNKRFKNKAEAEKVYINPKEGYPNRLESIYSYNQYWTDIGKMKNQKEVESYFKFLEEVRTVFETDGLKPESKIKAILATCRQNNNYENYFNRLNEVYGSFPGCLFYMKLTDITGIGEGTARSIHDAGIITFEDLKEASDKELKKIPGIGNKTVVQIRNYFNSKIS